MHESVQNRFFLQRGLMIIICLGFSVASNVRAEDKVFLKSDFDISGWVGKTVQSLKDIDPSMDRCASESISNGYRFGLEDICAFTSPKTVRSFLLLSDNDPSPSKGMKLLDMIPMPISGEGTLMVGDCFLKNENNRVAAFVLRKGKRIQVLKAWQGDTIAGKLTRIPTKNVKCGLEEENAE